MLLFDSSQKEKRKDASLLIDHERLHLTVIEYILGRLKVKIWKLFIK